MNRSRSATGHSTLRRPDRFRANIRWLSGVRIWVCSLEAPRVFCVHFPAWWTRYLDSVSAARLAQIPLSLLILELIGYCMNAVQLHVNAADVLVRRGIDRDGSR